MAGYYGKCQKHYSCHFTEHDLEREPPRIEQGSEEDFEHQRRLNDWDDDYAREICIIDKGSR